MVGPGLYLIDDGKVAFGGPLAVIGYYLLALIGFYFSVGLAAAADMVFRGQEATVGDGLAVSRSRFSQIAGWAALSAFVGLILSALQNQGGIFGEILGRVLAVGWALITFLAAPVIAFEGTGPIETLKRSSSLFRDKWGQQVTGNIAIGGAVFLFGMLPSILLVVAGVLIWASAGFVGALLVDPRRDRVRDRGADQQRAQRDLRRRPLPLRDSTARRSAASPPRSSSPR